MLLAVKVEETLKLHLLQAWLAVSHHVYVGFTGDLTGPAHYINFSWGLGHTTLRDDVVNCGLICHTRVMLDVFFMGKSHLEPRVRVRAADDMKRARSKCFHFLLKLLHVEDWHLILLFGVLLRQKVHPDLVKVVQLGNEEHNLVVVEVE